MAGVSGGKGIPQTIATSSFHSFKIGGASRIVILASQASIDNSAGTISAIGGDGATSRVWGGNGGGGGTITSDSGQGPVGSASPGYSSEILSNPANMM